MKPATAGTRPAPAGGQDGENVVAIRARLFRGLIKEVEEDVNKFLESHEVRILHMAQSESGDHVSLTLIVDEPEPFE